MRVENKFGEGIVAYNVTDLTPDEMRTIVEMDKKIADILISHHPEFKGNKMYLSDDDLFKLRGILFAFARYYNVNNSNTFDAVEDEIRKEFEDSHCSNATSKEKKPIRLPDDDLFGGE
jgi:hypothetical protein